MRKIIKELIERFLPQFVDSFEEKVIDTENGKSVVAYSGINGKIMLEGDSAISVAMAFYDYLRDCLNADISWCGDRIDSVETLPVPQTRHKRIVDQQYRAYMNYCTLSYSCAWWKKDRWYREIDFMAMNGINMPLFAIGTEMTWYKTLKHFGFEDKEILEYLSNPAYTAWQLMNNLEGEYSPLSIREIEKIFSMAKLVYNRMIAYGMTPIMQGFAGCVPKALASKFPDANIKIGEKWCYYNGTALLDPLDPLFKKMGTVFLEEQAKLYGKSGFYAADPFHESQPPVKGKQYLQNVGKTIFEMFETFDSNSVWVMQGWTPYKHIMKSVPKGKLLILDLTGNAFLTNGFFYGHNFIVGNLHNFGARINLHGDIRMVAANKYMKLKKLGFHVVGTGLFPEGIERNPIYYALAFYMMTRDSKVNIKDWFGNYARRRYGVNDENLVRALQLLSDSVYKRGTNAVESSSVIAARPAIDVKKSGPNIGFVMHYNPKVLEKALEYMQKASVNSCYGYKFDVADLSRQVLSNRAQIAIKKAKKAFYRNDLNGYKQFTDKFCELLNETDDIIKPFPQYSLEKWLDDAGNYSEDNAQNQVNKTAAKQLITIWGPSEKNGTLPDIYDYAWKEWSGLIKDFYLVRWKMFFDYVITKWENGDKYEPKKVKMDRYKREAFRADEIYNKIADFEMNFIHFYDN